MDVRAIVVKEAPVVLTVGVPGPAGPGGSAGPPGLGVPTGGTAGQHLVKTGPGDYDVAWTDLAVISEHADLSGLQGGQAGEYYHLTAGQFSLLPDQALSTTSAPSFESVKVGPSGLLLNHAPRASLFLNSDNLNGYFINGGDHDFNLKLGASDFIAIYDNSPHLWQSQAGWRFEFRGGVAVDHSFGVNWLLGTASAGTGLLRGLVIGKGTAPTTSPADTVQMWGDDQSPGNTIPYFRTEDGTVIGLDQDLQTTAAPTFAGGVFNGDVIGRAYVRNSYGTALRTLTGNTAGRIQGKYGMVSVEDTLILSDSWDYATGSGDAANQGAASIFLNGGQNPGLSGSIVFNTIGYGAAAAPVERARIDSSGNLGLGTNAPKSTLHSTGSTILGGAATAVADGDLGNGQINVWLDETAGNLSFRIRKSDGTYATASVAYA